MHRRSLYWGAATIAALISIHCTPTISASATALLLAPVDSACLRAVLAERVGAETMRPTMQKRTRYHPASLYLYHGRWATWSQTYPDSGYASLSAEQDVAHGFKAIFSPPRVVQDSVRRWLGSVLIEARDRCGGRAPPDQPDVVHAR